MLPKRKKENIQNLNNENLENLFEKLQLQIEEERSKNRNKNLRTNIILKKNKIENNNQIIEENKLNIKKEIEINSTNLPLKPTAFTYFDKLTEKNILLSDDEN